MADSNIKITEGSDKNVDTRTNAGGDHRQVIVVGDPSSTDAVAVVQATDPASNAEGVVVRDVNTTAIASSLNDTLTVKLASELGLPAGNNTLGSIAVFFDPSEPTVVSSGKDGATTRPIRMDSGGAIKIYDIADGSISIQAGSADIGKVHDLSGTATLPVTDSGTFAGISALGKTLASPISGSVIKVCAYALTTTAQVHTVARFTNGAGSATEFWRIALQAPAQGIAGANLAVSPPAYLFAIGANVTLALHTDNASLIHYSVTYFRESA